MGCDVRVRRWLASLNHPRLLLREASSKPYRSVFLSVGNLLAQDYPGLLLCVSLSGTGGIVFFEEVFCWLGNILYLCDVK